MEMWQDFKEANEEIQERAQEEEEEEAQMEKAGVKFSTGGIKPKGGRTKVRVTKRSKKKKQNRKEEMYDVNDVANDDNVDSDSEEEDEPNDSPNARKERLIRRAFTWTLVGFMFGLGVLSLASSCYALAYTSENNMKSARILAIVTLVLSILAILVAVGFVVLKLRKRRQLVRKAKRSQRNN